MRKLIDADAYLKSIRPRGITDELWTASEAYLSIMRMQPVDAVPVVRCKDCKSFSHGYCRFHEAKFVNPKAYCFWGERKDGEQCEL